MLLQDFVRTDTWPEARSMLERHPELLSDDAAKIMANARVRDNPSIVSNFEAHRAFLWRCQEVGIDLAFAELTGEAKAPENLSGFGVILVAFCDRDTDEDGSEKQHDELMEHRIATDLAAQLTGVWNDMINHQSTLPVAIIALPGHTASVRRALDTFYVGDMTQPPVSVYPIEYVEPTRRDEAVLEALVPLAKLPGQMMTWIAQYRIKEVR
jgi:hypothetical protein